MICRTLGAFRRARSLLEGVVDTLHGDLLHQRFGRSIVASVNARSVLAPCLAELGEFEQATTAGEEAVQIAETVQQPGSLIAASLGACSVLLRRGSFHQAVQRLEDLGPSRGASLAAWSPLSAGMLGYAYAMTGRSADALPLLEQAVEHAHRSNRTVEMILRTYLVEAYLLAGRHADPGADAARVLELSRQRAERGVEARTLYLLGEIASHGEAPETETAHNRYGQALALAGELGMRPLVAHCHLGFGKLYTRTDKREQAHEYLATATAMYRDMGMTFWLEKAEVEMRDLG
jgi:tetratricopeptide (TPR) repeat protein